MHKLQEWITDICVQYVVVPNTNHQRYNMWCTHTWSVLCATRAHTQNLVHTCACPQIPNLTTNAERLTNAHHTCACHVLCIGCTCTICTIAGWTVKMFVQLRRRLLKTHTLDKINHTLNCILHVRTVHGTVLCTKFLIEWMHKRCDILYFSNTLHDCIQCMVHHTLHKALHGRTKHVLHHTWHNAHRTKHMVQHTPQCTMYTIQTHYATMHHTLLYQIPRKNGTTPLALGMDARHKAKP